MEWWRDLRQWVIRRPLLADTMLALGLLAASQLLVLPLPAELRPRNWAVAIGFGLLGAAAVAVRRRWLWPAIVALSIVTVLTTALWHTSEDIAILVLTYTAAAYLSIRQSALATALIWLPGMAVATVSRTYSTPSLALPFWAFLLFNAMMAAVAYLAGRIAFTRRRYVAALMERARAAEENQRAVADQAVADERRRIARELHDMVAHHVSVMGVLATGSRRVLRRDPDAADEALATIEETGRTALREMRRVLDVMRTGPERADPLTPQPDLAGLLQLVEQVREAGLTVTLNTPAQLHGGADPGIALTVYRIVQEALTNVLKHGGPDAAAEVRLDARGGWLTVEVFDTGIGPTVPAARGRGRRDIVGHGLLGMRERVALYGGTLRTGPRPGGGFRVYATIPLDGRAPARD